jgi:hypothetical protein
MTKHGRGQSDKPNKDSRFIDDVLAELRAWQRRLRIHPTALNDPRRSLELAEKLGSDRFSIFKSLVASYQKEPNLENYVRLRRGVPDAEIDIALFGGVDPALSIEEHLSKHGIDPLLVYGALDAFLPDMDELSLRLMECLVAREKLPKGAPGHLDMRRDAISDALVDYLIVMMLEATEWNKQTAPNQIPSSLIVLIRERLRGAWPDLRKKYLSRQEQEGGAYLAAHHFETFEQIQFANYSDYRARVE